MPGLDIALTWLTEFVADEVVLPILGAGVINMGRLVWKRSRPDDAPGEDAENLELEPAEAGLVAPDFIPGDPATGGELVGRSPGFNPAFPPNLKPDFNWSHLDRLLVDRLVHLEQSRLKKNLLLKQVQISRLQQDRLTWLIWSVGFGWSLVAALTPFNVEQLSDRTLALGLFLGANFIMGLVRIAVDASLLNSLQVEVVGIQHQLDVLGLGLGDPTLGQIPGGFVNSAAGAPLLPPP
jgi:hypothetical protein